MIYQFLATNKMLLFRGSNGFWWLLEDFLKKMRYSLVSLTVWPEFKTDLMGPPYCKIVFYVIGYSWKKHFRKDLLQITLVARKKWWKMWRLKRGQARDRECAKVAHTLWLLVWKIIARCAPIFKPSKPLALWNYYSGLKRKKRAANRRM